MLDQIFLSHADPLLQFHRVSGRGVLPGLAYVDMLFQLFADKGRDFRELELRDLTLHAPLALGEGESITLTVSGTERPDARSWDILIEGSSGPGRQPLRLVTAEMRLAPPSPLGGNGEEPAGDPPEGTSLPLSRVYADCRDRGLIHTGWMRCDGILRADGDSARLEISLAASGRPEAEDYLFHPALLDGSALAAGHLAGTSWSEGPRAAENRLFLPLHFRSFRAAGPIQKDGLVRFRRRSLLARGDTLTWDMDFLDRSGRLVARLEGFTAKQVRPAAEPVRRPAPIGGGDAVAAEAGGHARVLAEILAERLGTEPSRIDPEAGYYEMGLDSAMLLSVVKELEVRLSRPLEPTLLFEFPTVSALAGHLAARAGSRETAQRPEAAAPRTAPTAPAARRAEDAAGSPGAPASGDIAVIGLSGRYPGAGSIAEFWNNLLQGKDCVTEIPPERWDAKAFESYRTPSGKSLSRWGGFLSHPDHFDPQFFRVSPREAKYLDPQERLFLTVCWEAIEDAGYTPRNILPETGRNGRRDVGVFVGVMHKDYAHIGSEAAARGGAIPLSLNYAPIANRVSYFCNFHGPSMAIDSVCSSSLTAVHLALASLRNGECRAALAGGVNLSLHPNKYLSYGLSDFFSSDGRCRSFGKDGDGYVSGEGVGAVLLKPLDRAVADGDNIYAVIKGSAVNHVGRVSGITVPCPTSQGDLIERCLEKAGIDARTLSYLEAHGTGTFLGDPIEIQGLIKAFSRATDAKGFCALGSVKSNIGHAEAAAGISGLTKVILQLRHRTLVPSLHSRELNPALGLEGSPFYVQQARQPWEAPSLPSGGKAAAHPRRAGISSFGATGSNAHLIVEEYPDGDAEGPSPSRDAIQAEVIVPLAARDRDRLREVAERLLAHLAGPGTEADLPDLARLAHTLQTGREAMDERLALVVGGMPDLMDGLRAYLAGSGPDGRRIFASEAGRRKEAGLLNAEDSREMAGIWASKGQLRKLADFWAQGFPVDWASFYGSDAPFGPRPRRLSLPTYPFARESYWIESTPSVPLAQTPARDAALLPYIHRNTSQLGGFRFTSRWTGQEAFLRRDDAGAAAHATGETLLEMALQAIRLACPAASETGRTLRLAEWSWAGPRSLGKDPAAHVSLIPQGRWDDAAGALACEIHFGMDGDPAASGVLCQGTASVEAGREEAPERLDPAALPPRAMPGAGRGAETLSPGIEIVEPGSQGWILARVTLPEGEGHGEAGFSFPPGMLEAAFRLAFAAAEDPESLVRGPWAGAPSAPMPARMSGLSLRGPISSASWFRIRLTPPVTGAIRNVLDTSGAWAAEPNPGRTVEVRIFDADGAWRASLTGLGFPEPVFLAEPSLPAVPAAAAADRPAPAVRIATPIPLSVPETRDLGPANGHAPSRRDGKLLLGAPSEAAAAPARVSRRPVELDAPAAPRASETPAAGGLPVEMSAYGEGVYAITVTVRPGGFGEGAIAGLKAAFRSVADAPDAKALLLRIEGGSGSIPGGEVRTEAWENLLASRVPLLPLDCPVPVVATLRGNLQLPALLLASGCDFLLCGEGLSLGASAPGPDWVGARALSDLWTARFGRAARARLDAGGVLAAASLRDPAAGPRMRTDLELDSEALALAFRMADKPRPSLALLKAHLAGDIRRLLLALTVRFEPAAPGNPPAEAAAPCFDPAEETDLEKACARLAEASAPDPAPASPSGMEQLSPAVRLERHRNGVAVITLADAAERNAFTPVLVEGLGEAFRRIRGDSGIKAVVLTGQDRYFSLGGTKDGLLAIQEGRARYSDAPLYELPLACEVPVIAAMQGHGIGAGWVLGMFCDWSVFSAESVYSTRFMRFGFTPGFGSTLAFPRRFGLDLGRELLFTAADFKGRELRDRGIRLPVVGRAETLGLAFRIASGLAAHPREELVRLKAAGNATLRSRLPAVVDRELAMHGETFIDNAESLRRIQDDFQDLPDPQPRPEAGSGEISRPAPGRQDAVSRDLLPGIQERLIATFARELDLRPDQVDPDRPLIEMGLDSISGVTWVKKVNTEFQLSLAATTVYNHPTIREFANHVLETGLQKGIFPSGHAGEPEPGRAGKARPAVPAARAAGHAYPVLASLRNRRAPAPADGKATGAAVPAIAVIGMSGQFPKSRNLEEYWENLSQGRDCISEIPADRWDVRDVFDADPQAPGKTYCRWMGALDDVDRFDPLFFNISPREAELMDPQQRLFLQNAWSCIEDAGYDPTGLSGTRCGVFAGSAVGDYGQLAGAERLTLPGLMGSTSSILAARIAYFLNLQGPCLSIDTACSSSLVAIATACDSLATGGSDLALAGGSYVMSTPEMHIMTSKAAMLSKEGRCFTFDQRADGFVPGEGVGVLLLKRLEDAERDGDRIAGVIRGWGVNQDGKTNGITAPNQDSQTRLEKGVYEKFGIDPDGIQMVEAHGTGTKLGDPIEVEGLKEAFRAFTGRSGYCALGSVKSNIGHLLTAAGVAGCIKVLLALKHRKIPPTLHFETLNEHIRLEESPFYVSRACADWIAPPGRPRRSAISSFGFSGTNAHMVFEEYAPAGKPASVPPGGPGAAAPALIVLSARNPDRLKAQARNLLAWIRGKDRDPTVSLADMAYTLQTGRAAMEARFGAVVRGFAELEKALEEFLEERGGASAAGAGRRAEASPAADGMEQAVRAGDLVRLLAHWLGGEVPPWQRMDGAPRPRRAGLPTYPFTPKRYWVRPAKPAEAGTAPAGTAFLGRRMEAQGVESDPAEGTPRTSGSDGGDARLADPFASGDFGGETAEEIRGTLADGLGVLLAQVLGVDVKSEFASREEFHSARFTALGVDSLTTQRLCEGIRSWLGVEIPPESILSGNRVSEVLDRLEELVALKRLAPETPRESSEPETTEVVVL